MRTRKLTGPRSGVKPAQTKKSTRAESVDFTALPREILSHIGDYLDQTSLVELSRAASTLTFLADLRLWRCLQLQLPTFYGERPLVQPFAKDSGEDHTRWAREQAKLATERYRQALKLKVKRVIWAGGEREWMAVREIRLESAPGALSGIQQILEYSTNLSKLVLCGPRDHPFKGDWAPKPSDTLDWALLSSDLRFKALTSLQLRARSFSHIQLVSHLLHSAPNLTELDIEVIPLCVKGDPPAFLPIVETEENTRIDRLRYRFVRLQDDEPAVALLETILARSPKLRALSLPNEGLCGATIHRIVDILLKHPSLEELYFPVPAGDLRGTPLSAPGAFPSLKTQLLEADTWIDEIANIPVLPGLQRLYLCPHRLKEYTGASAAYGPNHILTQALTPYFAQQLRQSRALREINPLDTAVNLDQEVPIEPIPFLDPDDISSPAVISSYLHGESELLHFRITSELLAISDTAYSLGSSFSHLARQETYTCTNGKKRTKSLIELPKAVKQHFTDLDGLVVPLVVLDKMRAAQGVTKAEWDRRGVKLRDAAWKVLMDWKAVKLKDTAE